MGLVSVNLSTIILNIVNVLIFFGIIKIFLWKPVTDIMEKRKQMVLTDLEEAKKKNEEADQRKQKYQDILASARAEADEIVSTAKKRSRKEREEAIRKTQAKTEQMLASTKETIEFEKMKAMQEVQNEIAGIALAAAQKVIVDNANETTDEKYLNAFLGEAGGEQ